MHCRRKDRQGMQRTKRERPEGGTQA